MQPNLIWSLGMVPLIIDSIPGLGHPDGCSNEDPKVSCKKPVILLWYLCPTQSSALQDSELKHSHPLGEQVWGRLIISNNSPWLGVNIVSCAQHHLSFPGTFTMTAMFLPETLQWSQSLSLGLNWRSSYMHYSLPPGDWRLEHDADSDAQVWCRLSSVSSFCRFLLTLAW